MTCLWRIACWLFGHRYRTWQRFGFTSERVVCPRCGRSWGMHHDTRSFIEWSRDLEGMYVQTGRKIRPWPRRIRP